MRMVVADVFLAFVVDMATNQKTNVKNFVCVFCTLQNYSSCKSGNMFV